MAKAEVTVAQPAPVEPKPRLEPQPEKKVEHAEVVEKEAAPAPQPKPVEQEPPVAAAEPAHAFTEHGLSSRNDEAISFARQRLRGVTRVALDARGDADLVKQLGQILQNLNLTLSDDAVVRIRFYGTVTHRGFGRKTRAAEATILKNGQPILRYEMKPEEYRVGDNPAEAFARVLSDVFGQ